MGEELINLYKDYKYRNIDLGTEKKDISPLGIDGFYYEVLEDDNKDLALVFHGFDLDYIENYI